MMASTYTWTAGSGDWSDGANWLDVTNPGAGTAPGSGDTATITATNGTVDLVQGAASAATLTTNGTVAFDGSGSFGSFVQASGTGGVDVIGGGIVTATDLTASLHVAGAGSTVAVSDTAYASIDLSDHASFAAGSVLGSLIVLDATSTAEVGGGHIATAGTLAIDTGALVGVDGMISAPVLDNGTLEPDGNGFSELVVEGSITGTGVILLPSEAELVLKAGVGSGVTIEFDGNATLSLPDDPNDTVAATITGFSLYDTIIFNDLSITAAAYTSTGPDLGTVDLLADGTVVDVLTLAGDYSGDSFLVNPVYRNGLYVAYGELAIAAGTVSTPVAAVVNASTSSVTWSHQGQSWADPASWLYGGVPSVLSSAEIDGTNLTSPLIVNGNGDAATLTVTAAVALNGTFDFGALITNPIDVYDAGEIDILPNSEVTTGSAQAQRMLVDGAGSSLDVTGTLTVSDNNFDSTLFANDGGRISAGSLSIVAAVIGVDAASSITVGNIIASNGNLSVGAGATFDELSGRVEASVDNEGTISISESGIFTGSIDGHGTLEIGQSSSLDVFGSIAATQSIVFSGEDSALNVSDGPAVVAALTGLTVGDSIIAGPNVVSAVYTADGTDVGTLTLRDGSGSVIQSLHVSGSIDGNTFLVLPSATLTASLTDLPVSDIVLTSGTLQTGALPPMSEDPSGPRSFTEAAAGSWNDVATWGGIGTPGSLDTVSLGLASGLPDILTGNGTAAMVTETRFGTLSGIFNFGSLVLPNNGYGDALSIAANSTITVGNATVVVGDFDVIGSGADLTVTGTLTLEDSSLMLRDGAMARVSALAAVNPSGAGFSATISVDAASALVVGNDGTANAGALTVGAGSTLSDNDVVLVVDAAVVNDGVIAVGQFGTIEGSVSGSGALSIGAGGTLTLAGTVDASQTIDFAGSGAALSLAAPTSASIVGFAASDTIELAGAVSSATYTATGANIGTLTLTEGGVTQSVLTIIGSYDAASFIATPSYPPDTAVPLASSQVQSEIVIAACFAEGTRIATERGAVAIEHLTVGTLVHTPWNQLLPIEWIGRRRTDCRHHPRPHDVWPVRVAAHAFGPDRPVRDLFLSPDHAVHIDGLDGPDRLIPVRYLINDATIRQIATDEVTYWHIELPRHDVVLAEGLSCESYLDTGNRSAFENCGPAIMLHPDFARAVWAEQACAELTLAGPSLIAVRAMLLANAQALGHLATDDPGLTVCADGEVLASNGSLDFDLPAGTQTIELRSRTAVPAHVHADAQDFRRLGVAVAGLMLDGAPVLPGDPRFGTGWLPAEPEWRWTDGCATLATGGAARLSLRLLPYLTYWVGEDVRPESVPASPQTPARPEKLSPMRRRVTRGGRAARL